MSDTPLLQVTNLRFGYAHTLLFDDFSLSVNKGAIVALIGPNGAGKSTLMHCLTGIIRPFFGDIRIADKSMSANPTAARRYIGYLPDDFGLYDRLTVRQHLDYVGMANKCENVGAVVEETARATRLLELMDKPADEMSRGQRQRLGIAMAIIHKPALLLLDEPASGLDPLARSELADLLNRLKEEGATIIVSSHILTELREYATDYIILQNGRTVGEGALTGLSTWRMRLAMSQTAAAKEFLQQEKEVSALRQQDDNLYFQLASADDAPALLKQLIMADLSIIEFATVATDIEYLYKERVQ